MIVLQRRHPDAYEEFRRRTVGQSITITTGGGINEERTYKNGKVRTVRISGFGGTIDAAGNVTIDKHVDPEVVISRVYHEAIHKGQGPQPAYRAGDYDGWRKAQETRWDHEVEAYLAEANWQISAGLAANPDFVDPSTGLPDERRIREFVRNRPEYNDPYVPSSAEIAAARAGTAPPPSGGTAPPPTKFPIIRRSSSPGSTVEVIILDDAFFRSIEGDP